MKTKQIFYGSREFKMILCDKVPSEKACDCPQAISDYIRAGIKESVFYSPDKENFIVILLNVRRKAIGFEIVTTGVLDSVLVHPREIFRSAIIQGAHAVIVCHNHPSGDSTPSDSDIRMTREIVSAGKILRIEVLDHLILGRENGTEKSFYSFRESGMMCY